MDKIVEGKKIKSISTMQGFKDIMIDLFRGYPAYEYFGIFESYFGDDLGMKIINTLKKDKLIEVVPKVKEEQAKYRLSNLGLNFAISMINLEYSERVLEYSKKLEKLTYWIIGLTILSLILSLFL